MYLRGDLQNETLITRAHEACNKHDINFLKYICDEHYASNMKCKVKHNLQCKRDGLSDSVRQLLLSDDPYNKMVLNLLLTPF